MAHLPQEWWTIRAGADVRGANGEKVGTVA